MRILDNRREIAAAQTEFVTAVRALSAGTRLVTIGYQSGNTDAEVMWLPGLGIWAFFGDPPHEKSPGERYWNAFGMGQPHGMVPITCEINPPKRGINRQAAGAFARDRGGATYVVHRGIFNARGRIPKADLRRNFNWTWLTVNDGDRTTEVMPIGALGSSDFPRQLRDFIREVARFKAAGRDRPSDT